MVKNIVAFVVGMIAGNVWNIGFIILNGVLFSMPSDLDMNDQEAMREWIETLPAHGFLLVLVAHVGQAGVGGWIAARMCKSMPMLWPAIIGALTVAGAIYNLAVLGGPAWVWIDVPLIAAAAWYVGQAETKRRAALPAAE